jgi:hypothetical protein
MDLNAVPIKHGKERKQDGQGENNENSRTRRRLQGARKEEKKLH